MTIVEPTRAVAVDRDERAEASTTRSEGSRRRRRVDHAEAIEIARLYADTNTSTSEIRERFGIGDSSLYRIVQRQGVALRRVSGRSAVVASPNAGVAARTSLASANVGRRTRGNRSQFRLVFAAERVVQATDIGDAVRQVEALGAIEVTAVSRQD